MIIEAIISLYLPKYSTAIIYMLQSSEYQVGPYLRWYWRTQNFARVMKRRNLDRTTTARLLLAFVRIGMLLQITLGVLLLLAWLQSHTIGYWELGLAIIISYPVVWAHIVVIPLLIGKLFIANPKTKRQASNSELIFVNHPGTKIAVAGSYGKTTMKELLLIVLKDVKKVAATPANKNVVSSHAAFARSLDGDEDILIIEYGEGKPGDVASFAHTTHPEIGIITGLAPAHLDHYPTLKAAGEDIFSLAGYLHNKNVYVNAESKASKPFIKPSHHLYSSKGVLGWKVQNVTIKVDGLSYELAKGDDVLHITSTMVGRHQIGPLSLVAILAMQLGLSKDQVEVGIAKTKPFEHRMQPRNLNGAWVIDDTYNGNIDGIRAGLQLLSDLDAPRKIYVTPGLVDQGVENDRVHREIGTLIAAAKPDKVILMHNSVSALIQSGLSIGGYDGEVIIEEDPLNFYTNIGLYVAVGDLVVMQNDWTDNYA